jgi:DNA-3-methyladenine glycosylase II
MDAIAVRNEVTAFWGMSDWSAAILSIFYFGHEDVFPASDGTLLRVQALLQSAGYVNANVGGAEAAPYRSYLALYLWKLNDDGLL